MKTLCNTEGWTSLGVPSIIIKALLEQNFHTPTAIQALSIPSAIFGKKDILGAAETGSGKTLAFGIPVLNGILELNRRNGNTIASASGIFKETSGFQENDNHSDKKDEYLNSDNDTNIVEVSNKSNKNGIGLVQVIDKVHIKENNKQNLGKPLYGLILTPTRELAIQIKNHLIKAAKYTDIKVCVYVILE